MKSLRLVIIPALGVVTLLALASPAGASLTSIAMQTARYAVATASHNKPARIVTADDVSNAASTYFMSSGSSEFPVKNPDQLTLDVNLGELPNYPRLIIVGSGVTFKHLCIDLPAKISATPKVVTCTAGVFIQWQYLPSVLMLARSAISSAAAHHRAVSGADVTAAASSAKAKLFARPTFKSGQGGKVKYVFQMTQGTTTSTGYICVLLPKAAYGIPAAVAC